MSSPHLLCRVLLSLACLALPAPCLSQADYAREQRWAEEITPAILVGDPVKLEIPSGRKFLAIYAPASNSTTGVIVVHGVGVHPDWGLINSLRSELSEQGYTTLSVQMPVRAADAKADQYPPLFPEAAERLASAVAFLRAKGMKKIAIVSHSMGSRMTNYFLNHAGDAHIDAWVAIGISGEFTDPATLKVPVLDLYGEKDLPAVLDYAAKRAAVLRGIRGSGQLQVAGANHFFAGVEGELVRRVRQFLDARVRTQASLKVQRIPKVTHLNGALRKAVFRPPSRLAIPRKLGYHPPGLLKDRH